MCQDHNIDNSRISLTSKDHDLVSEAPGIYKFLDQYRNIIYVGKAKILKKRVSSYFTKVTDLNIKTKKLVQETKYIETIVVNAEYEALLLENSLIKEYQPKYNILLKDDKSFPSACIGDQRFPKIFNTRRIDKDRGEYFGPYTNVKALRSVLDLLHKIYKIRTCSLLLTKNNIDNKKFKVCLEYHIGNCLGPCEGLQSEEHYLSNINDAKEILKGNIGLIRRKYQDEMTEAAKTLNFELAQELKTKIDLLDKFHGRALVVSQHITNIDVLTMTSDSTSAFANYMVIVDGSIKVSETIEIKKKLFSESDQDMFHFIFSYLQKKFNSFNKTVVTNVGIDDFLDYQIVKPKIGDKKKLMDMSLNNTYAKRSEKLNLNEKSRNKNNFSLKELQDKLRLKKIPQHIECFDNSNTQGSNPVASMVCFKNGKPSKKDYRKYNIKTVVGPDDFGSMKEVVERRYTRLLKYKEPLPDLIVIDGGKGQLNSALEVLKKLDIYGEVAICGIAKKLEEIYLPKDPIPQLISKKSDALRLLQYIRDESHRFAITFHRSKRSKAQLKSILDGINGIGPVTKGKLLAEYGNLDNLKNTTISDLTKIIGNTKAATLKSALRS